MQLATAPWRPGMSSPPRFITLMNRPQIATPAPTPAGFNHFLPEPWRRLNYSWFLLIKTINQDSEIRGDQHRSFIGALGPHFFVCTSSLVTSKISISFMIRLAMTSSLAQSIRRDIRSKGPPEGKITPFSIYAVSKLERSGRNAPFTSISTPPASITMTAPAAMSQQWIPISKKASTAPVATRHMLVAAVPDPRSLPGQQ